MRGIGAATLAVLESDTANIIHFLELEIDLTSSPEVTLRLHSGLGTITWGGKTWTGAGSLMSLSSIQETNKQNPAAFRAVLSGIDTSVTSLVFNQNYYRKPCKHYLGGMNDGALVEDPFLMFSGFIEKLDMVVGASDGDTIELTAESEFILFKRSRNVRYTDRQLQSEYPGDLGFQYLEATSTAKVVWRGKENRMGSSRAASLEMANAILRSGALTGK